MVSEVDQVEIDGAVIGIDNNLDRVPNVVELAPEGRRLSVRKIVARRVGILDPEEPPVADHEVWVLIQPKEGSDRLHPLAGWFAGTGSGSRR